MSSVTSDFAQVARRVGYFLCVGDVSGYTVTEDAGANTWTATVIAGTQFSANDVLEDMGEIAKYQGNILRKVRKVTQVAAGGALAAVFIVVPGGEYPMAPGLVTPSGTGLTPARVARLG
jgi:hypothetical protein